MKKYLLLSLTFTILTIVVFFGILYRTQINDYLRMMLFESSISQEDMASDFKDVLYTVPDYKINTPESFSSTEFRSYSNENVSLKIPNGYQISLDGDLIKFSKDDKNYFLFKSLNTSKEVGSLASPELDLVREGDLVKIVDPFTNYQKLNISKTFLGQIFFDNSSYKIGNNTFSLKELDVLDLKHRFIFQRVSNPATKDTALTLDEKNQVVVIVGNKKTLIFSTFFNDESFETLNALKLSLSSARVIE